MAGKLAHKTVYDYVTITVITRLKHTGIATRLPNGAALQLEEKHTIQIPIIMQINGIQAHKAYENSQIVSYKAICIPGSGNKKN